MPDACFDTCSGTKYHTSPVFALPTRSPLRQPGLKLSSDSESIA